jgi:predicted MPP superfamily phosphohydrolase
MNCFLRTWLLLVYALAFVLTSVGCQPFERGIYHLDSAEYIVQEQSVHFMALGDWGRSGRYHQNDVGVMMQQAGRIWQPSFIISTGDNFYEDGVGSVMDPQWNASFEDVYTGNSLQVPWYPVLGNHDIRGNVQAQLLYSKLSSRWRFPNTYYSLSKNQIFGTDTIEALFVFLDTNPLIESYYDDARYRDYVVRQDTSRQLSWLDSVLLHSDADWKIVSGHHPVYGGGKKKAERKELRKLLKPFFNRYQVDLYLCGHKHDLQLLQPDGPTTYIVTGAGSKVSDIDKTKHTVFAKSIQGFVSVSLGLENGLIQFIDYRGNVLYRQAITNSKP